MECRGQENNLNLPLHVQIQHKQAGPLQKGRGAAQSLRLLLPESWRCSNNAEQDDATHP